MNKDKVTEIEEPCTATPCNQSELIDPLETKRTERGWPGQKEIT